MGRLYCALVRSPNTSLRPIAEETAYDDEFADVKRIVIRDQKKLSEVCLSLAVRDCRIQVHGRIDKQLL